jgi:putative FmdB family regulatory protein
MPTYEYECTGCGKHFDYFQRITEEPKTTCEECGGKLQKLLSSGAGLIFKGSGFYITDYKKSGGGGGESSGGGSKGSNSGEKAGGESKDAKAGATEEKSSGSESNSGSSGSGEGSKGVPEKSNGEKK